MNVSATSVKMNLFMRALDEKSRQIVTYLSRQRHAGIRELANLTCASSDMEVLTRIREVINPKAREVVGEPIITFEHSKIDPLTGEKIVFSWWLKKELTNSVYDDTLLDIIDEKEIVRVIASVPSKEKNVEVEVKDDFLILSGKEYHIEVPLYHPVEKVVKKTVNNGILEVKLNKIG